MRRIVLAGLLPFALLLIPTLVLGAFEGERSTREGRKCPAFSIALRVGDSDATTGNQVSDLQRFLQSTGDFTYPEITGYYGVATQAAVQKWQARNGIVSSGSPEATGYGLVGPRTRGAMSGVCNKATLLQVPPVENSPSEPPSAPETTNDNPMPTPPPPLLDPSPGTPTVSLQQGDDYLVGAIYYGGGWYYDTAEEEIYQQRQRVCSGTDEYIYSTASSYLPDLDVNTIGWTWGCSANDGAGNPFGAPVAGIRYGPSREYACVWNSYDQPNSKLDLQKMTDGCSVGYSRWETVYKDALLVKNPNWSFVQKFEHLHPKEPLSVANGYLGYYDARKPETLRKQIDVAQQYGVDFFAIDWWVRGYNPSTGSFVQRQGNESIDAFMEAAEPEDSMQFAVYLLNSPVQYFENTGANNIYKSLAEYWADNYMSHSHYLTVDGRPVIFWYNYLDVLNTYGKNTLNAGIKIMRDAISAKGYGDPIIVAAGPQASLKADLSGLDVDAFSAYLYSSWAEDNGWYANLITNAKNKWYQAAQNFDIPVFPTMENDIFSTGNMGGISKGSNPVHRGSTENDFRIMAQNAKQFVDEGHAGEFNIILDYAWNEWIENNVLEPTEAYGYSYLEVIRDVFGSNSHASSRSVNFVAAAPLSGFEAFLEAIRNIFVK